MKLRTGAALAYSQIMLGMGIAVYMLEGFDAMVSVVGFIWAMGGFIALLAVAGLAS